MTVDIQEIGVIGALFGVVASFILTIVGQRQDRRLADNSAKRAEAAARVSEGYTARVVDALERVATGQAADVANKVKWSLAHHGGDTYVLQNDGTQTAYDVNVDGHDSLHGPSNIEGGPDVDPDGALTFMAVRTMGTSDSTITVSWLNTPGSTERNEWKYPLPPRPPR